MAVRSESMTLVGVVLYIHSGSYINPVEMICDTEPNCNNNFNEHVNERFQNWAYMNVKFRHSATRHGMPLELGCANATVHGKWRAPHVSWWLWWHAHWSGCESIVWSIDHSIKFSRCNFCSRRLNEIAHQCSRVYDEDEFGQTADLQLDGDCDASNEKP